jgi:hypothetical protein
MKPIALIFSLLLSLTLGCVKTEKPKSEASKTDEIPLERPKPRPYPNELPDSVKSRVLSNSFKLQQELFDNLLEALEKKDTAALVGMMISEKEFKEWLWWEFPASRPETNISSQFAWDNHAINSSKGLRLALRDFGGNKLVYVSHRFEEAEDKYQTFVIHTKTRVMVADTTGKEWEMKVFGSVVEMNGRYKLLSYRDRD